MGKGGRKDPEDFGYEDSGTPEPCPPRVSVRAKIALATSCWIALIALAGFWNVAPLELQIGGRDTPSMYDEGEFAGLPVNESPTDGSTVESPLDEPAAEPPVWERTYGGKSSDGARCIVESGDGGFIVAGQTTIPSGNQAGDKEVYLLKIDSEGNKVWEKTCGRKHSNFAFHIVASGDGGFLIAGATCVNDSCVVANKAYVLKIDFDGNLVWERIYDGVAKCIARSDDGGFLLTGHHLFKIDSEGNLVWEKDYGGGWHIVASGDGGFVIAGGYVMKIDSEGEILWNKTLRDGEKCTTRCIVQSGDDGYVAAGYTEGDVYLLKIDSEGNKVWEKTYGGRYSDVAYSITRSNDGGFVAVGATFSFGAGYFDVYLLKIDDQGDLLWHRTYGGSDIDWAWSIISTGDDGYIVAGDTSSFSYKNLSDDMYILRVEG